MIYIPEYVKALQPYKAGKPICELQREKGLSRIIKLASNENPLGPSPKAMEAIRAAVTDIHRYPDPAAWELVQAISRKYNIQPQHIVCGHGTDALLGYAIGAFSEPGDELLTCEGTFIGIYVSTKKQGRILRTVPLKDYGFDLDGIIKAITPKTRIIFIANPNNPTGTMIGKKEFESFMERVPSDVLVILDEAYYTYAGIFPDYPQGVSYWYDNMVVTRTLSKAYGLGGLRVGFAVGPDHVIEAIFKVRYTFEPHHLAQVAATAALDDDEFLERTVRTNTASLARMKARFEALGIEQVRTAANFILALMPSQQFAADFYLRCLDQGLILRHVASYGVPNGIRINSGTEEETTIALDIIEQVWRELNAENGRTIPAISKKEMSL
ncbi:MAG: histidinol-phosphate transaminase [Bacteroidetes bacterium]|nr:histidinol-phosphate transaminase [Bacteroidota bacterium]